MMVYDDADTVAFGTGYMTDEAYKFPVADEIRQGDDRERQRRAGV